MTALFKFFGISVGLVLIGIGVGAVAFAPQIGDYARDQLTRQLSEGLDAPVRIGAVAIDPWHPGVVLREVVIENPEAFREGPAVEAERVLIVFDLQTIFAPAPTVRRVVLEDCVMHLRHEAGRGSNFGALIRSASEYEQAQGDGRRGVRIEELAANGAKLRVSTNIAPVPPVPLNVAPFTVRDPGDGGPLHAARAVEVILRSLVMEAITLKGLLNPIVDILRDAVGR